MTRSTRATAKMTAKTRKAAPKTKTVARTLNGSSAWRIASISDWNCRTAAGAPSLATGASPHRNDAGGAQGDVPVLLMPEAAVDFATLQQLLMPAHRRDLAALENEDGVGIHQRRQPVRDHDHRSTAGDPADVLVDDGLAVGIESARRFVEDQNLR